jgi:hypothetical protein
MSRNVHLLAVPTLAVWALMAGCSTSTAPVLSGVLGARSVALVCAQAGGLADAVGCSNDSAVLALVGGGSRGTVSLARPGQPAWVDLDRSVPGYTPLRVDGIPTALVVDPPSKSAFAAIAVSAVRQVARLDLAQLSANRMAVLDRAPLAFEPTDLLVIRRGDASWLVVTDPEGGRLWVTAVAGFSASAQWTPWQVGGSPASLAWLPGKKQLWVGHLHHPFVSVVDAESGALVGAPIPLDDACRDGLDNDGDGQTDRADRGCDRPDDRSERDPELGALCSNGQDDDEDGQTDADDAACKGLATAAGLGRADACRDGLDNDGDGQTDYPDDAGCTGYGDSTEASERSACQDGVDDDGDGLTDAGDPDCATGTSEWQVLPATDGLPVAAKLPCANGEDDDGDGQTDLADGDCFNRSSGTEAGADRSPAARIAVSSDERVVACAHQGRGEVLFLDVATRSVLLPVRGATTPFVRTSRLDERDGVRGLALGAPATALAAVQMGGKPAIAIATTPGGLVIATLGGDDAGPVAIQLTASSSQVATSIARPSLLVGGSAVDLGASVPPRYASLGPLRTETTAAGTSFYGILPSADATAHRTEQWRVTYQGELPGSPSQRGSWRGPARLHDAQADFCSLGVVAGDLVLLPPSGLPGCPAKTIRVAIAEVHADTLVLDPSSAAEDAVVTADNQYAIDLASSPTWATAATLPPPACRRDGGVVYAVRAAEWLVSGSRTGILSRRPARDGSCSGLPTDELGGARVREPRLQLTVDGKPERPTACPYSGGTVPAVFAAEPMASPLFASLQIVPGCRNTSLSGGQPGVQVLPSLRDMTWVFNVTAGFQPRRTAVGSAPLSIQSGPNLKRAYVVDGGSGVLYSVDLATGAVATTLQ